MGQTARLCIIHDQFIAGHDSCELRRHLDSVSPETPIRDIVDHCRVWESHADSNTRRFSKPRPDRTLPIYMVETLGEALDDRVVAAVATTQPEPGQLETLLRHLISGPVVPPLPPEPVPSVLEQLLQRLLMEAQAPRPTPPESASRHFSSGSTGTAGSYEMELEYGGVFFSCGKAGHGTTRCPNLNEAFPFMLPGGEQKR